MAKVGTGFTDIGQYLAANQGTLANERAGLTGMVGGELDDATNAADKVVAGIQHGTDPTAAAGYGDALQKQNDAENDAQTLGTPGGLQGLLGRKYGDSADQGQFDSSLIVGSRDFDPVQARAKSLGDYLDQQAFPAAAALPAAAAPTTADPATVGPPTPGDVAQPSQPSGIAGPNGVRRPVPGGGGASQQPLLPQGNRPPRPRGPGYEE